MKTFLAHIDHKDIEFQFAKISQNQIKIMIDGRTHLIDFSQTGPHQFLLKSNNQNHIVDLYQKNNDWQVFVGGEESRLSLKDEKTLRREKITGVSGNASGQIICPMPGKVVDIKVSVGQKVKKGDGLVTVEAMKMQNEFKSPLDGEVKKLSVKVGDSLEEGVVMVEVA